jgi:predicted permease
MLQAIWTNIPKILIPYSGLLIIIAIGILAAWRRILTPERIDILSEIVIVLIFPIFTFYNAATGSVTAVLNQAPWLIGLGLVGPLVGYGLATLLSHLKHWDWTRRSVFQVSGATGNTGFLGIPICTALFGNQGTILALLYDLGNSIYLLTLGLGAFQKEDAQRSSPGKQILTIVKRFCNPIIVALLIGAGFSLAGIQMPDMLESSIRDLSGVAIPVMLLLLGGLIYNSFLTNKVDGRNALLPGLLKLIAIPVLTWAAVSFLSLSPMASGVAVIQAAMPSSVTAVTFASRYKADDNLASSITMLTTLVSILTIPIFAAAVLNGG